MAGGRSASELLTAARTEYARKTNDASARDRRQLAAAALASYHERNEFVVIDDPNPAPMPARPKGRATSKRMPRRPSLLSGIIAEPDTAMIGDEGMEVDGGPAALVDPEHLESLPGAQ